MYLALVVKMTAECNLHIWFLHMDYIKFLTPP